MSDVDVRVAMATQAVHGGPFVDVLRLTAVNRGERPVTLWTFVLLTTFGVRVFLEKHLDYPVTLQREEWCAEWTGCRNIAAQLHAIGCEGRIRLVPMVLERDPAERIGEWTNELVRATMRTGSHVDRRGIEHRGAELVFDAGHWLGSG
jgi:hypothetical protein